MKSKKNLILLFNPRIVSKNNRADRVFVPPLNLLALSSPILQAGFRVKIMDGNFDDDHILPKINIQEVLCIGISAMSGYQIKDGLKFAKSIRQLNRRITIIWGGVHVSLMPNESIKNKYVDVVVLGQGEETFLNLVLALKKKQKLTGIKGIYFKDKRQKIIRNDTRELVDIRKYPILPYDLINIERYLVETKNKNFRISNAFNKNQDTFFFYYSSVGCPFACNFCASSKHSGRRWIGFSEKRVLGEIEYLVKRYKANFIQMVDAEFFINTDRAMKIAQGFIDRGLNIHWKAQIRADTLSSLADSQVKLLKKSGYVHAEIGVESGSPKMLKYIDKKITISQVIKCAHLLKKNGILASFIFLFGLPYETKADIKKTFKLASKLKKIMPESILPIYFYNPYPGVPMYYDSIKLGMKAPKSLEGWSKIDFEMRENNSLIPWLNKKYVDYCHKVIIFYLPLAFPANIKFGTITNMKEKLKKSKYKLIWKILHKLAKLRVKYQYFDFPFEWRVYKTYLQITGSRFSFYK